MVFLSGGGHLSFGDVAAVIDVASRSADYTALITPMVELSVGPRTGNCFDPNIYFSYILM